MARPLEPLPRSLRLALAALLLLTATCLLSLSARPDAASAAERATAANGKRAERAQAKRRHARHHRTRKQRARRKRGARAHRAKLGRVAQNVAVARPKPVAQAAASDVLDAGFEEGLFNWNTAGAGEVKPTVVNDVVRSGGWAGRVALTGSEGRSELILGGNGGGSTKGMIEFREGDEYWYGFSFYIASMVYGHPGAHNLIMQFKGDDDGSPGFGLQLWDYEGDHGEYADNPKGLWSHGPSMGGDRFLAAVPERTWHDVAIHFRASGVGAGFYAVYLDGQLIDTRDGVSMIAAGASFAYIKNGIYRGHRIPGDSEIRLDAARLGPTQASVSPG